MRDIREKREREKRIVTQMIELYCRKNHGGRGFAKSAESLQSMQDSAVTGVRSWKTRHSVQIARYIATSHKCDRR